MRTGGYPYLPYKHSKGTFCILIITSGRILRYPYSRFSEEPKYKTRQDAEIILKAYLHFTNNNRNTKIKRQICEFEIINVENGI